MPLESGSSGHVLADVLDRVLDKGIVIDAAVRVSIAGIELLGVDARVVVASIETYLRHADALAYTDMAAAPRRAPPPPLYAEPLDLLTIAGDVQSGDLVREGEPAVPNDAPAAGVPAPTDEPAPIDSATSIDPPGSSEPTIRAPAKEGEPGSAPDMVDPLEDK